MNLEKTFKKVVAGAILTTILSTMGSVSANAELPNPNKPCDPTTIEGCDHLSPVNNEMSAGELEEFVMNMDIGLMNLKQKKSLEKFFINELKSNENKLHHALNLLKFYEETDNLDKYALVSNYMVEKLREKGEREGMAYYIEELMGKIDEATGVNLGDFGTLDLEQKDNYIALDKEFSKNKQLINFELGAIGEDILVDRFSFFIDKRDIKFKNAKFVLLNKNNSNSEIIDIDLKNGLNEIKFSNEGLEISESDRYSVVIYSDIKAMSGGQAFVTMNNKTTFIEY